MYTLNTAENVYKAVLDGIKKESTSVLTPESFNRLVNNYALTEWLVDKAGDSDKDQPIVDALRNLYETREIDISSSGFPNPGDYYRLQSVAFKYKDSEYMPVKRMRSDSVSVMNVNPYRRPERDRIYYFQRGNFIVPYPEDTKVVKAKVYYLKRPQQIIYNMASPGTGNIVDLFPEQVKEVIDICVRVFLERVKEERYQTVLLEESIKNQKSL